MSSEAGGATTPARRAGGRRALAAGAPANPASSSRPLAVEADDVVGGDVERGPLLAVVALVFAGLEATLDEDRLPLRSCSAARSARSPKMLTRNQSVPSSTQPPWPSGLLWLTATVNWVTGPAVGDVAHLRVAAQVADEHDLAERHRRASRQSMAAGAASLSDSSISSGRPRPLPRRPAGREHRRRRAASTSASSPSRAGLVGRSARVTRWRRTSSVMSRLCSSSVIDLGGRLEEHDVVRALAVAIDGIGQPAAAPRGDLHDLAAGGDDLAGGAVDDRLALVVRARPDGPRA